MPRPRVDLAICLVLAGCAAAPTRPLPSPAKVATTAPNDSGTLSAAAVAAYLDREERDLRARTAGSGIEVVRRGNAIRLALPAALAFDFNAATLRPAIRAALDPVAQTFAAYRATTVEIGGHTDAVGTDAVNQRLSDARASSVAGYLGTKGIDPRRITARGYGKARPVAPNDTDDGRARNRRVEIILTAIVAGARTP